jgi:hypothetical protein
MRCSRVARTRPRRVAPRPPRARPLGRISQAPYRHRGGGPPFAADGEGPRAERRRSWLSQQHRADLERALRRSLGAGATRAMQRREPVATLPPPPPGIGAVAYELRRGRRRPSGGRRAARRLARPAAQQARSTTGRSSAVSSGRSSAAQSSSPEIWSSRSWAPAAPVRHRGGVPVFHACSRSSSRRRSLAVRLPSSPSWPAAAGVPPTPWRTPPLRHLSLDSGRLPQAACRAQPISCSATHLERAQPRRGRPPRFRSRAWPRSGRVIVPVARRAASAPRGRS